MPGARANCPRELAKCTVEVFVMTGNSARPTISNTLRYEVPGNTNRAAHGRLKKGGVLLKRLRRRGSLECAISVVIRVPKEYGGSGKNTAFHGVKLTSRR